MNVVESLELDEHGYPDEAVLKRIKKLDIHQADEFMRKDFADLASTLPCSRVWVEKVQDDVFGEVTEMRFATGGWSGCESFVEACLANVFIRAMFYHAWQRGGLHTFRIK